MRRWHHPPSRDLWVAAHPAPSKPHGCCPPKKPSKSGFSSKSPPTVRHHRLPPKILGFRATPSIPISRRDCLLAYLKWHPHLPALQQIPGSGPRGWGSLVITSILHGLLPLSYRVRVKADVFLQCLILCGLDHLNPKLELQAKE